MRILLSGICGHMGREVMALASAGYHGAQVVAGVDIGGGAGMEVPVKTSFEGASADVDCIVDFSHHSMTEPLLSFALEHHIPLVIATTGQTPEERAAIVRASEGIPLFFAANYSFGIALLLQFAKQAAAAMPDAEIEIVEKHHDRKLDAPSGTALAIADAILKVRPNATIQCGRCGTGRRTPGEIGIHSLRMGNIVGEHEVLICTPSQSITLKHEAYDRSLFAEGALIAAEFVIGRENGLYHMKDLVKF